MRLSQPAKSIVDLTNSFAGPAPLIEQIDNLGWWRRHVAGNSSAPAVDMQSPLASIWLVAVGTVVACHCNSPFARAISFSTIPSRHGFATPKLLCRCEYCECFRHRICFHQLNTEIFRIVPTVYICLEVFFHDRVMRG